MLLRTVIDHLKTGDFSLTNLGNGNEEEGLTSNNLQTVINLINLGLIDLYKQFNLSIKEVYVQQYAHIQKYTLHSNHAVSNKETQLTQYIVDTEDDPFLNDILHIMSVYDEKGCPLPLNDTSYCNSVFTPKYNVLQVPCPVDENANVVVYRASPVLLEPSCDFAQEVDIPISFLDPLLLFVASRFKSSRPNQDAQAEGRLLYEKYLLALNQIKEEGLYNTSLPTSTKLIERGFV